MANEQYRVILNNGTRVVQEQMNQAAAEGFKAFAVDNQSFIYMKREVDELAAPQMTIVDTPLTRPTALTEPELVLYGMLQRDAVLDDVVYRYPASLVSDIYHLVERLLMQVQSPPTPTRVQLETELRDMAAENVRLLGRLDECRQALMDRDQALSEAISIGLRAGPALHSVEHELLETARRNWQNGVSRYQDLTNLLEIIRRLTGITA